MKKEKLEILYSLLILIAVPAVLMVNTILLVQSTRWAFNYDLQRKADLVNAVIAETVKPYIISRNTEALSSTLNSLELSTPPITHTSIMQDQAGKLTLLARSSSAPEKLDANRSLQLRFVYERKQTVAQRVSVVKDGRDAGAWTVMSPVVDAGGEVIAVVSSTTLTSDAEQTIDNAFRKSFIVLAVSILVVVVLLFRHFRLVGYIQLLAKQRELNQTMSDFLSVATHELKAPTTIIKGYISNVQDGMFGEVNDQIKTQLQTAVAQTDRLNALVQDLLNVSRIEQGRIEYHLAVVDTQGVLQAIAANYSTIAAAKGIQLDVKLEGQLPPVYADAGRVQEIFTNLIDNAIKYTAAGTVTVTQRLDKDTVTTSIRDTGFGMSPDAKKRLFQRFYRIKTSQTQHISGTGLGLWIIKQYIVAMGGTIDVESMEGVGSNFIVSLPVARNVSHTGDLAKPVQ